MDAAIQEIVRLRLWARTSGVLIVHVRHQTYPEPGLFGPGRGSEIVEALTPVAGESVVVKSLPNAFAKTGLDALPRQAGRDQLIVTGFMTHMCLDSTTRAALDLGYTSFVVASATADRDLADLSGAVVSSEEVKRASRAAPIRAPYGDRSRGSANPNDSASAPTAVVLHGRGGSDPGTADVQLRPHASRPPGSDR